ncbi:MAG TPA: serine/threonine-protein kinase, partial [Lacipirellulaceae bacterium]
MSVINHNIDHHLAGPTSIEQAMDELRRFPRDQWLDLARIDQAHRWRQRLGASVEQYLVHVPEFRADVEESLVLINGEAQLRREIGEAPQVDEYQRRFPDLSDDIALQFDVDRILNGTDEVDAGQADDATNEFAIPGYQFLEPLGRGASGVVYKARQESLDRLVAIKVAHVAGADPKQLVRQRQEAEILAKLHHANVVHIYEVRDFRGCLYLVMEYVAGTNLADSIRGRAVPPAEAARLTLTLAETVQAVHEAGILHRDLKPSNVLQSTSGVLKITDFGLAKLRSSDSSMTAPDSVLGTPSYMAPEQAVGEPHSIGPTADVYSLGAILYQLLTGRPPFLGATVLDTLWLIRMEQPVAPRRLQPRLSRDLETICLKCLAKSTHQRYETAAALAEDLRRFLAGEVIAARRPGLVELSFRLAKRRPLVLATAACCLSLAGVIGAMAWTAGAHERRISASALIESIATADAQAVPQLLDKLSPRPEIFRTMIREARAASAPPDAKWVNLSVAELTADSTASESGLIKYLPIARPAEIALVVQVLAVRANAVREEAWRLLEENARTDDACLNLGCLAAQISPDDPRWAAVAPAVAHALILQPPLDMSVFTAALAPARKALVPSLVSLYRDPFTEPIAREATAGILARFASDQPSTLADVIVDADASAFRLVLPALQQQSDAALPRLRSVANAD